jgi:hypothetical protein
LQILIFDENWIELFIYLNVPRQEYHLPIIRRVQVEIKVICGQYGVLSKLLQLSHHKQIISLFPVLTGFPFFKLVIEEGGVVLLLFGYGILVV